MVKIIRGRHRDCFGHVLRTVVSHICVIIPGGKNHHCPQIISCPYRILCERVAGTGSFTSPAIINDICAIIDGIFYAFRQVRTPRSATIHKTFNRHNFNFGSHADHSYSVITNGGNCPGDMRPMAMNIPRIIIRVSKIPSPDIIHKAVAIVIHAIVGDLPDIGPDIRGNVGMVIIHARVHDRHNHALALREVPGLGRLHFLQPPEVIIALPPGTIGRVVGIVRDHVGLHKIVRLGVLHVGVGLEFLDNGFDITFRGDLKHINIG